MSRHYNNDNGYLMGSILGGAVAATVTYFLYGTEAGQKKRDELKDMAVRSKDRVMDYKDMASSEFSSLFSEIQNDISETLRSNKKLLKNLDSIEMEQLKERLKMRWEEAKEDILETIEEVEEK